MKKFFHLIGVLIIVGAAAFLQAARFSASGIRPDFLLIVLIPVALKEDMYLAISAAALALFLVKSEPAVDLGLTVFFLFIFGITLGKSFFPWREVLMNLVLILTGIAILYMLADPRALFSFDAAKEIILDLALGAGFFAIFSWARHNN